MPDPSLRARPTLKEVARLAGVSIASASYALHNRGSVGEATRQRVREAAETLGYRPNAIAQAMKTGKSGALGLIVPDLSNPLFPALAQTVVHAAREAGHRVLIADSQGSHAAEIEAARDLAAFGADGLIWFPVNDTDSLAGVTAGLPTVVIDRDVPGYDQVQPDYRAGGLMGARLLTSLGHRAIGIVAGPVDVQNSRVRADAAAMELQGEVRLAWRVVNPYALDLEPEVIAALESRTATAILCGADIIALGVMQALRGLGLDVPGDVSVLGFDDIHWCELTTPTLSSVRIPIEEIGAEAVSLLLQRIAAPRDPRRRVSFDVRIVERGSVAAPAKVVVEA
ncbi:LacI family transcriptional regulator [Brevundimonas sp. LM2]|uniref:LacI family DNA-binding transcriptional regulator n=1 Tax=Brevundimonas sp. LM2 TaxID=1938605 RepID=UPI000983F5B8|nr:LacI family DNA-binding transcriptional regulator [Brevundimonas sp. LM2]AQR62667.1 LacI family transcriptional regulator [Brevundimonas sp. LM2]